MKKTILIAILCVVIVYMLFAFGNWEISPGKWSQDGRMGCALCFVLALMFPFIGRYLDK